MRGKKIPDGVKSTLRQMPRQPNAKQRSLLDFERFFDHVFQLANHPKPLRAKTFTETLIENSWTPIKPVLLAGRDMMGCPLVTSPWRLADRRGAAVGHGQRAGGRDRHDALDRCRI